MDNDKTPLVLASASPRRLELLQQLGITPNYVVASDIDESLKAGETPRSFVKRLAQEKALAVEKHVRSNKNYKYAIIFAADTVVAMGRHVLQKPETEDEARSYLQALSGRTHKVYTAMSCINGQGKKSTKLSESRVRFKTLKGDLIKAYLSSGEWQGKAGGYAIQGYAGCFIERIIGSYSAIKGLDLSATRELLSASNYSFYDNWQNNPTC